MNPRLKLVKVAVPVPLADAFDYLVADADALPPVGSTLRLYVDPKRLYLFRKLDGTRIRL